MADATEKEQSAALKAHNAEQAEMYAIAESLSNQSFKIAMLLFVTVTLIGWTVFSAVLAVHSTETDNYLFWGRSSSIAGAVAFLLHLFTALAISEYVKKRSQLNIKLSTFSTPPPE